MLLEVGACKAGDDDDLVVGGLPFVLPATIMLPTEDDDVDDVDGDDGDRCTCVKNIEAESEKWVLSSRPVQHFVEKSNYRVWK